MGSFFVKGKTMKRTIESRSGSLTLECNAATPFIVKRLCGFDMLRFFTETDLSGGLSLDDIEKFEMIIYCMHLQGIKSTRDVLNESMDNFPEWLAGYSIDEMTTSIIPEGVNLWTVSEQTYSVAKNQEGQQ